MKDIVETMIKHPIGTVIVVGSVGGAIRRIIKVVSKVSNCSK